jgi:hypothetical protein
LSSSVAAGCEDFGGGDGEMPMELKPEQIRARHKPLNHQARSSQSNF